MSQITFGIPVSSKKEGDLFVKAINTPEFKEIIKATKWGAFQTDYRMFKYFKKDFWKEFVNEDGKPLNNKRTKKNNKKSVPESKPEPKPKSESKPKKTKKKKKKLVIKN